MSFPPLLFLEPGPYESALMRSFAQGRDSAAEHPWLGSPSKMDACWWWSNPTLSQCSSFGTLGKQLLPFADNVTFVEYSRARKGRGLWDREHFLCLPALGQVSSLELEGRALKGHILARIVSAISPVSFRVREEMSGELSRKPLTLKKDQESGVSQEPGTES